MKFFEYKIVIIFLINSFTATNPAPSLPIPVGLNFLLPNFDSKI